MTKSEDVDKGGRGRHKEGNGRQRWERMAKEREVGNGKDGNGKVDKGEVGREEAGNGEIIPAKSRTLQQKGPFESNKALI